MTFGCECVPDAYYFLRRCAHDVWLLLVLLVCADMQMSQLVNYVRVTQVRAGLCFHSYRC